MRILWVGDSPTIPTGFGVVTRNLARELTKLGHEVVIIGINLFGDDEPYDREKFPYKIYAVEKGGPNEVYAFRRWYDIYRRENPDIVFLLNDPWLIKSYLEAAGPFNKSTKVVGYYPTDAAPIKPEWMEALNSLDAQVCYSHYAEDVVVQSNGGKRPKNLHQIYHGVNTETFRPVHQQVARLKLGLPIDKELFIVGMVARNQFRKRFDLLAQAFADFAKDKDDAKLFLHTVVKDIGFDIVDLARQLDIKNKLILPEDMTMSSLVSDERLNLIYNSFDVNALISMGDGFGLPVAESMATGCAQLVSNHSCLKELVEGHGGLTVETDAWIMNTSGINTWGGVSSVKDITRKLNILYAEKERRIRLAEAGYHFIQQPKFTWPYAAKQFDNIFKDLFHILRGDMIDNTITEPTRLSSEVPV